MPATEAAVRCSLAGQIATHLSSAVPGAHAFSTLGSVVLFGLGAAANTLAYQSLAPVVVALLSYSAVLGALCVSGYVSVAERRLFSLSFMMCWLWGGIAGLYASYLNDVGQNERDAMYFYEIVTRGDAAILSTMETLTRLENGGAMVLWRLVYDLFHLLGFQKQVYIGVVLNIIFVALTGVVGMKCVTTVYGADSRRLRRFTWLFVSCGMFWLYAAIHLRDAAVLFAVSLLLHYWLHYLSRPDMSNCVRVCLASAVSFLAFGLLRREFVFVPAVMIGAAIGASFSTGRKDARRTALLLLPLLVLLYDPYFYFNTVSDLLSALNTGRCTYTDLSDLEGDGSLGNALIVRQTIVVRLILGSIYVIVFPVPFWEGFQLQSAYHLFKSLHVLYMYSITPLFALACLRLARHPTLRTAPNLFLLFMVLCSVMSVAYSSLENRHFGAFLTPFLLLSLIPDLSRPGERQSYRLLLVVFLACVAIVHVAWVILKS